MICGDDQLHLGQSHTSDMERADGWEKGWGKRGRERGRKKKIREKEEETGKKILHELQELASEVTDAAAALDLIRESRLIDPPWLNVRTVGTEVIVVYAVTWIRFANVNFVCKCMCMSVCVCADVGWGPVLALFLFSSLYFVRMTRMQLFLFFSFSLSFGRSCTCHCEVWGCLSRNFHLWSLFLPNYPLPTHPDQLTGQADQSIQFDFHLYSWLSDKLLFSSFYSSFLSHLVLILHLLLLVLFYIYIYTRQQLSLCFVLCYAWSTVTGPFCMWIKWSLKRFNICCKGKGWFVSATVYELPHQLSRHFFSLFLCITVCPCHTWWHLKFNPSHLCECNIHRTNDFMHIESRK